MRLEIRRHFKSAAFLLVASVAVAQGPVPMPPVPRNVEEADLQDLQQLQNNAVNHLNPLSDQLNSPLDPAKLPSSLQWLKPILPLLNDKRVLEARNRMIRLVSDPDFQHNAHEIAADPNLKWLTAGLFGVYLFYVLIRRRVLGATDRWWMRFLVRIGLTVVFFFAQFLVAYAALGQPLLHFLWGLRKLVL